MEPKPLTASGLCDRIEEHGGRIHRCRDKVGVFVLTSDEELAMGLLKIGGRLFVGCPPHGYLRARGGKREWDIWINRIPIAGEKTIWEAAA